MFSKMFAFLVFVGFKKKVRLKTSFDSCISPQECMKCLFENFCLKSVGAKSIFVLKEQVLRRNLPTQKKLICVNVL